MKYGLVEERKVHLFLRDAIRIKRIYFQPDPDAPPTSTD
mgnify:CR=1 FL=1